MSNKEKINSLPIIDVLGKLGYKEKSHYVIQGKNIRMFDSSGRISDGWIGDLVQNRLFCKSGVKDGRFEGDIIGIIKGALGVEAGEALSWAENNFGIEKESMQGSKPKAIGLFDKWSNMDELKEEHIKYLEERGIEANEHVKRVVKAKGDGISVRINSESLNLKAIQTRRIGAGVDKKFRYQIEKEGLDGSGIFTYFPEGVDDKFCYIVEGMTDFLTLVQFGVNVIGLVSATAGIQYLKAFDKKYKLIYIPDNDESGIKSVQALDDASIKYSKFFISTLDDEVGDLNDAWLMARDMGLTGEGFLFDIREGRERPKGNIFMALKDALTKSVQGFKTGNKVFDWATGGIVPGTTYLICGPSGQGKTTWSMWLLMKLLNQGVNVGFFSMETRPGKMLAQVLGYHFGKNWKKEVMPNIEKYLNEYGIDNLSNLFLYNDVKTLEGIEREIKEEKLQVAFIDYAQLVHGLPGKALKEKMEAYAIKVQQIAQDTQCSTVSLSQVSKSESQTVPVLFRTPKEAGALQEASDTMINVGKYQGKHKVAFIKCKEGDDNAWGTEHDTHWESSTGEITIFDSSIFEDKKEDKRII